jgi:hypothetical protein
MAAYFYYPKTFTRYHQRPRENLHMNSKHLRSFLSIQKPSMRILVVTMATAASLFSSAKLLAADFAYIPNSSSLTLSVINTATGVLTGTIVPVTLNPALNGAIYTATVRPGSSNEVWFGQVSGNNNMLGVIDTTNNTLKTPIAGTGDSAAITFSTDGATAYVSDYVGHKLHVVNAATRFVTSYPTGDTCFPISSAMKADGSLLYFLCDTGEVKSFNTISNAITLVAATGLDPAYSLAYDPTGNEKIYVASMTDSGFKKIDLSDNSVATITVNNIGGNRAGTVAVRKNGSKVYVGDGGGKLHIIDATNTATQTEINLIVSGATSIGGLGISANDAALYAVMDNGTTHVIDVATNLVTKTIPADPGTMLFMIWGDFLGNVQAAAEPSTNVAPSASAVTIVGTAQVGVQLTGSYTYGDSETDAEGISTYRFVRSTDNSAATTGDNTDIATGSTGGSNQTYTVVAGDLGQYLFYCVTPKASTGTSPGTEVCSAATAAVSAVPVNGTCAIISSAVTSAPSGVAACTAGSVTNAASSASQFTWDCAGSGGGSTTTGGACSVPHGYTVTPNSPSGGTVSPSTAQVVAYNATKEFVLTGTGFNRVSAASGCSGNFSGTLNTSTSGTFTTGAITADCPVSFDFVAPSTPSVSGSAPVGTPAASATSMSFLVTFSEAVSGVDAADFTLTATGSASGTVGTPSTSDSGLTWTVPVSAITGAGTLRLDLNNSGTGIAATAAGLTAIAGGYTAGTVHTVNVPLINGTCAISSTAVTSAPSGMAACTAGSVTNAASSASQFTWDCAGSGGGSTTTGGACSVPRGYTVTPNSPSGGTVSPSTAQVVAYNATKEFVLTGTGFNRVSAASGCSGNFSGTLNTSTSGTFTTGAITADCPVSFGFVAPSAPSVSGSAPVGSPAASVTSMSFLVTFSEAVSGVDASDFTLTATGSASGTVGTPSTSDSGLTWTVPVSAITGAGTLRLDLKSSGTGIAATAAGLTAIASGYTAGTAHTVSIPVTSITGTSPSGGNITASFTGGSAGCAYASSAFSAVSSAPTTPPAGFSYPHGVLSFTTNNCGTGNTLRFTITYPGATLPANAKYYKYGPEFGGSQTPHWYALTNVSINGNQISFDITDDHLGDSNLVDPGVIADPGALAIPLDAASIPTLSEWALMLLSALLALGTLLVMRRNPGVA